MEVSRLSVERAGATDYLAGMVLGVDGEVSAERFQCLDHAIGVVAE